MLNLINLRRHYLALGATCIKDKNNWDKLVRDVLAKEEISPVTELHLEVMYCVRKYYLEKNRSPSVREICDNTGFTLEQFFSLFQDWPHTLYIIDGIVCYVLGLPQWHVELC